MLAQNGALINLYSAIFAAFSILFAKFALNKVAPYEMALGSSLFVCIMCCIFYKKLSIRILKTALPAIFIVSLLNALSELFWFLSLSELPPITFSLLSRTKVIFTFFLSLIIFKDRIRYQETVLVLCILLGSILFIMRGWGEVKFDILYILAALLSSFLYALTYALAKLWQIYLYTPHYFSTVSQAWLF